MKTITIPANITIKDAKVGEQTKDVDLSFATYMINNPLASNTFGGNVDDLEQLQVLINCLIGASVGDGLQLEDDMWGKINKFCNYPTNPYEPKLGLQLLPFLRAIRDAV